MESLPIHHPTLALQRHCDAASKILMKSSVVIKFILGCVGIAEVKQILSLAATQNIALSSPMDGIILVLIQCILYIY